MISRKTHIIEKSKHRKQWKLKQTKIEAHIIKKSNRQKLKFTTYTQRRNLNTQTQSDGRNPKSH
jgi:hypothetical protein